MPGPSRSVARQPEDVELAAAQRVDESRGRRSSGSGLGVVAAGRPGGEVTAARCRTKVQVRSATRPATAAARPSGADVGEDLDVALGLREAHGALERRRRLLRLTGAAEGDRPQDQDLDDAARPAARLGRRQEPVEQCGRLRQGRRPPPVRVVREESPGQGDVLVLVQVGRGRRPPRCPGARAHSSAPATSPEAARTRARAAATGPDVAARSRRRRRARPRRAARPRPSGRPRRLAAGPARPATGRGAAAGRRTRRAVRPAQVVALPPARSPRSRRDPAQPDVHVGRAPERGGRRGRQLRGRARRSAARRRACPGSSRCRRG